jgi:hypothetical protein
MPVLITVFGASPCLREFVRSFQLKPVNHSVLAANLDLNQVLNVRLIPLAANHNSVDRFSVAEFCEGKRRENSGATYLVPDKSGIIGGVMIDDVVADLPLDTRISLIKYDVEEMEFEAVLGSFGTIKKHRPVLYVEECAPAKRKFHYKLSFLLRLLDVLGYRRSKDHREIWTPSGNKGE